VVRYRLGGRAYAVQHGGSFKTQAEAKARAGLIAGELAAGRDPRRLLTATPTPVMTFAAWASRYEASRVDYADETIKNLGSHLRTIAPTFGDRDPATITPADVQE
jgi:hypothetical protein